MSTYPCRMCGNIWDSNDGNRTMKCRFCGAKVEGEPTPEGLDQAAAYARGTEILERARSLAAYETAEAIFQGLGDYEDAPEKLRTCRELKAVAKESDSINKNNRRLGVVLGVIAILATLIIWGTITENTISKREAMAGRYLVSESFVSESGVMYTFSNDGKAVRIDADGNQTEVEWEVSVSFFGDATLYIDGEAHFLMVNHRYEPEYIQMGDTQYQILKEEK